MMTHRAKKKQEAPVLVGSDLTMVYLTRDPVQRALARDYWSCGDEYKWKHKVGELAKLCPCLPAAVCERVSQSARVTCASLVCKHCRKPMVVTSRGYLQQNKSSFVTSHGIICRDCGPKGASYVRMGKRGDAPTPNPQPPEPELTLPDVATMFQDEAMREEEKRRRFAPYRPKAPRVDYYPVPDNVCPVEYALQLVRALYGTSDAQLTFTVVSNCLELRTSVAGVLIDGTAARMGLGLARGKTAREAVDNVLQGIAYKLGQLGLSIMQEPDEEA